jgi:S-adenosylmethionine:tRNA ribosyltransferase-isomerase
MRTSLFSFDLPERLIAQEPPEVRGTSRLMVLERNGSGALPVHSEVASLADFIEPGTLMVFNDTRVRKARMIGRNAETGGKGEFLFLSRGTDGAWDCVVDKAKKKRYGQRWVFPGGVIGTIVGSPASDRRKLELEPAQNESWFEEHGHIPLPPYMKRPDRPEDAKRYQTVYAREIGSAAAPTAGLHFTPDILEGLEDAGVERAWVTLNVGLGTFAPVRTEEIEDHRMHSEAFFVPEETAEAVLRAKSEGRKVLAVGTTAVRTLEASWNGSSLETGTGETDIFIHPGYKFGAVDQMFTNFHTPNSSLLMLVSAFYGRERLLEAYRIAVEMDYRFFSYGDAMLIR